MAKRTYRGAVFKPGDSVIHQSGVSGVVVKTTGGGSIVHVLPHTSDDGGALVKGHASMWRCEGLV